MEGTTIRATLPSSIMKSKKKYQIVFVASEVGPWSKTGGLGEVMDGLPIALAKKGHRVMTIGPRWDQYYDAWDTSCVANIEMGEGGNTTPVRYFHAYKQRVDRVFVDHPIFLERVWGMTAQKYYGPTWGKDWNDSQVRFSLFARAALQCIKTVAMGGYIYGENCVIVCNDWHTSLLPLYMHMEKELWRNTKVCLLMHNLVYQGRFAYEPWMSDAFSLHESIIQELRCNMSLTLGPNQVKTDCVNWIRGTLRYFDKLITVSPTYATEMMNNPLKGVELSLDLQNHRGGGVIGILNGIKDTVSPNSETLRRTANLPFTYDSESTHKKVDLKLLFQSKVGLPVTKETPLFMFIGRLDFQKGVDVLLHVLENEILPFHNIQVCIIGQGREDLVAKITRMKALFPTKFASEMSFKGPDKYMSYAGSDFAMMPSRYEPCGLVQMESMRFGVLPIVSPTGGLKDTVHNMETGIVMQAEMNSDSIVDADSAVALADGIRQALDLYKNNKKFCDMQKAAMLKAEYFNWDRAAAEYVQVFDDLNVSDITHLCIDNNQVEDHTEDEVA